LKGSLKDLDLSDNPMGDDGIEELGDLKNTQLMKLNLSNVGMESKGLIAFLDRLRDCKDLETLILDKNDFSNNWFIRIQEVIEDNKSIKDLRMV
jgi:Ran GTPase-activating protein (RanGAP) involved in mRNA processing and transport